MTEFIASIVLLLLCIAGGCWIESAGCHSQWSRSGFQTSWGPVQGCLISKDGKVWIPADNYREIK